MPRKLEEINAELLRIKALNDAEEIGNAVVSIAVDLVSKCRTWLNVRKIAEVEPDDDKVSIARYVAAINRAKQRIGTIEPEVKALLQDAVTRLLS